MNPIIIAGSARIQKYPVVSGVCLDWTPVDIVAATTIELALLDQPQSSTTVYHVVNPNLSTYGDLVQHLSAVGVPLVPTSPKDWWAAIQADDGNPCLAIEAYIEEAVVSAHEQLEKTGGQGVTLDGTRTKEIARDTLGACPPLDLELWSAYVKYWRSIGFLPA
jgi:hypothetical protein